MRYENEVCVICESPFQNGDDIVVCPECGTPQHRECWNKENRCGNFARHDEGYIWKPQQNKSAEEELHEFDSNRQLGRICPVCGTNCPPDFEACPVCHSPLTGSGNPQWQQPGSMGPPPVMPPFQPNQNMFFNTLPCPPDTPVGDITARDAAVYIQVNSKRYISRFLTRKKLSWNWGAFFFAPYWFFYRKFYRIGIIAAALFLAVSIVSSVFTQQSYKNYYSALSGVGSTDSSSLTDEQIQEIYDKATDLAKDSAPFIAITLLLRIGSALSADFIYKKKMLEDFHSLRSTVLDEREFGLALIKKGGVSIIAFFLSLLGYYIVTSLIMQFI